MNCVPNPVENSNFWCWEIFYRVWEYSGNRLESQSLDDVPGRLRQEIANCCKLPLSTEIPPNLRVYHYHHKLWMKLTYLTLFGVILERFSTPSPPPPTTIQYDAESKIVLKETKAFLYAYYYYYVGEVKKLRGFLTKSIPVQLFLV